MKFSVFQLSRRGGRELNEDRMGYCYTSEAGLFLLADGMGGHAEGEVAAQIALHTIAAQFQRVAQPGLSDAATFLSAALLAAHHEIMRYAQKKRMRDSPRTTIVAAVITPSGATWAHCGDSRLYWVRDGQLLARTRDHSFAERARAAGEVDDLPPGFNRNVLYTCLGGHQQPVIDVNGPHVLEANDRLLLCSDGLWDVLPERTLLQGMLVERLEAAVPTLVGAALRAAGHLSDNVTALAVEWQGVEAAVPVGVPLSAPTLHKEDSLFHTTIQPGDGDADDDALDLDEEEIERRIAEINEAILRAAPRKR